MQQKHIKMSVNGDDLELLYVPDVLYAEYDNCNRYMQLIIPYRRHWEKIEKFPLCNTRCWLKSDAGLATLSCHGLKTFESGKTA